MKRVRATDEATTPLDRILRKPKDRVTYEYDFGDSWIHDVVLEKVLPAFPGGRFPIMLDWAGGPFDPEAYGVGQVDL